MRTQRCACARLLLQEPSQWLLHRLCCDEHWKRGNEHAVGLPDRSPTSKRPTCSPHAEPPIPGALENITCNLCNAPSYATHAEAVGLASSPGTPPNTRPPGPAHPSWACQAGLQPFVPPLPSQHPLLPRRPGWWRRARPGRKRRSSGPAPAGWLARHGCAYQSRPAAKKLQRGANRKLLLAGCLEGAQRLQAKLNARTWLPMKTTTVCRSPSTEPLLTRSANGPDAASAALPNAFRTKLLATSSTSGTTWRICASALYNPLSQIIMAAPAPSQVLPAVALVADCPAPGRRRADPCPRPTPHGCSIEVGAKRRLHY